MHLVWPFLLALDCLLILFAAVAPHYTAELHASRIHPEVGQAYVVPIGPRFPSPIVAVTDDLNEPYRSKLRLFEDGRPLGPPNASHASIRSSGNGAYSFWQGHLRFATSDNSDPRHNGRQYTASVPLGLAQEFVLLLMGLHAAGLIFARRQIISIVSSCFRGAWLGYLYLRIVGTFVDKAFRHRDAPYSELWSRAQSAWLSPHALEPSRNLYWLSLRGPVRLWIETAFRPRAEILVIVLIAGLPVLIPYLAGFHYFLFSGVSFSTLPMKMLAIRAMAEGELPLWTSALGAGLPMVGDGVTLPYDPRNVLWLVLDPLNAYVAALLVSRCLFAAICYLYFRRRLGFARGPALCATCVYFFGTIFVMEVSFSHLASGLEALPMMLWLSERLLERPDLRRALHLALGWFLVLLTCSIAYFIFLPFLAGGWTFAVWLAAQKEGGWRRLVSFASWFFIGHAWGLMLWAFALLPFLEMARNSNRGSEYLSDPFAARSLWGLLFGPLTDTSALTSPPLAFFLYVGIVALPVMALAFYLDKIPRVKAAVWLGLLTAGGILAMSSPLKPLVAKYLPIVNTVAFFRLSFFWGFLAAVLVGYGLQQQEWRPSKIIRNVVLALIAGQGALIGFFLIYCLASAIAFVDLPESRESIRKADVLIVPGSILLATFIYTAFRLFGLTLLSRRGGVMRRALVGSVLAVELILFFTFYSFRGADPFPRTTEVSFLEENASPNHRLMQIVSFDGTRDHITSPSDWAVWSLHLNGQAWWRVWSANAYNSLVPASYWNFIRTLGDRPAPWRGASGNILTEKASSPLLQLLGVRWLIARFELDPGPYKLVHRGDAYYVYELVSYLPRAYFVANAVEATPAVAREMLSRVGSGKADAEVLRHTVLLSNDALRDGATAETLLSQTAAAKASPGAATGAAIKTDLGNRLVVAVDAPNPGWLVLSDNDYPGWQASVNGKPAEIRRANLFARAVPVPAGRSEVVFEYRPRSLVVGSLISLAAAVVTGFALVLFGWTGNGRWRRRRQD